MAERATGNRCGQGDARRGAAAGGRALAGFRCGSRVVCNGGEWRWSRCACRSWWSMRWSARLGWGCWRWSRGASGGRQRLTRAGAAVRPGGVAGAAGGEADRMAAKVAGLRIFADAEGRFNESVADVGGAVLVVSQFTLISDVRKGRRPSFTRAARPDVAAKGESGTAGPASASRGSWRRVGNGLAVAAVGESLGRRPRWRWSW